MHTAAAWPAPSSKSLESARSGASGACEALGRDLSVLPYEHPPGGVFVCRLCSVRLSHAGSHLETARHAKGEAEWRRGRECALRALTALRG